MHFTPGQSLLHRLHPVVKLAWLAWITIAVFVFDSAVLPGIVLGCAVLLLWLSGVAPWRVPGKVFWLTLGLAILVTQILAEREGNSVLGPITDAGLRAGLRAAGRLLAVILASTLFVVTTEPFRLAAALMAVGLPYRWGFTLVTALRLAPVFKLETHHIYRAQMVRGVAYDRGRLRRLWLALRHLTLPLLVSALRTAHALALSMEGRGFGLHPQRTSLYRVRFGAADGVVAALLLLSLAGAGWYSLR